MYRRWIFHQLGGIILLGWENSAWIHIELLKQSRVDAKSGLGNSVFFFQGMCWPFIYSLLAFYKPFPFSEAWASLVMVRGV